MHGVRVLRLLTIAIFLSLAGGVATRGQAPAPVTRPPVAGPDGTARGGPGVDAGPDGGASEARGRARRGRRPTPSRAW